MVSHETYCKIQMNDVRIKSMQINGLSNGFTGFQNAVNRANEAAQTIASATGENLDNHEIVQALVDLSAAEQDALANAKVIESEHQILGSIINLRV